MTGIYGRNNSLGFIFLSFFFFFFPTATHAAYGSSQAKDRIWAAVATYALVTAVATLDS